jgi:hypothetical protein
VQPKGSERGIGAASGAGSAQRAATASFTSTRQVAAMSRNCDWPPKAASSQGGQSERSASSQAPPATPTPWGEQACAIGNRRHRYLQHGVKTCSARALRRAVQPATASLAWWQGGTNLAIFGCGWAWRGRSSLWQPSPERGPRSRSSTTPWTRSARQRQWSRSSTSRRSSAPARPSGCASTPTGLGARLRVGSARRPRDGQVTGGRTYI